MGGPRPIWWTPGVKPIQPRTELELLERVFVCPNGCYWWLGGTSGGEDRQPYPRILRPGTRCMMAGHRYVVQVIKCEVIPPGYQVDHVCVNSLCVRPAHLEVVTAEENIRRRVERNRGVEWFEAYQARDDDVRRLGSFEDELIDAIDGEAV